MAAEISAFVFNDVISMYTGGVRKKITKTTRKKYERTRVRRRSRRMLARATGTASASTAVISRLPRAPHHAAQYEYGGDRQDREHEERDRRPERKIVALDAELEGPGRENVRLVHGAARGQHAHDVEIGKGDDEREEHGDRDDVLHHRQRDVPELLPPVGAVDVRRLVELAGNRFQGGEIHD